MCSLVGSQRVEVWVVSEPQENLDIRLRGTVTPLAGNRGSDERCAAPHRALLNQPVDVVDNVIWQPNRNLGFHAKW